VNYNVTSTDNCTGQSLTQTAGLASGSVFPYGTTINTFTVTDASSNAAGCSFTVTTVPTSHTLNIKVFLQGLYTSGGSMHQAMDYGMAGYGSKWAAGIADTINVELHDSAHYNNILYTAKNIALFTSGNASVNIPATYSGNYYITVKHRNHIETTTANWVSFANCAINYDFTTGVNKAYGNNMLNIGGFSVIYAGELTSPGYGYPGATVTDGTIDLSDFNYIFSSFLNGDYGYNYPSDINGDGAVDLADVYFSYYNYNILNITALHP
jgi:hypothetical protein